MNNMLLEQRQTQRQIMSQQYDWDSILTPSKGNPHPLAPTYLERQGVVTEKMYQLHNGRLGQFSRHMMEPALMGLRHPAGTHLQIASFGLGRDVQPWLEYAVRRLGYRITISDVSSVACSNARRVLTTLGLRRKVRVAQENVEIEWQKGNFAEVTYLSSGLLQTQPIVAQKRWLRWFGVSLKTLGLRRRIFSLQALEDYNPLDLVQFGRSTPMGLSKVRTCLAKGYGKPIRVEDLGRFAYLHYHVYSLLEMG